MIESSGDAKKKPVLDVLRQDPNTMDVDRRRELRRCYNCGGELTVALLL